MNGPYQSVVSIGPKCMTSAMLQRAGLKHCSGPFDWIFSSFAMVRDCIEGDFGDFLNVNYLKGVPAHRRLGPTMNYCDHVLYKARYDLDSIFNHYDPREPERYQYLRRCVHRFRDMLASGAPHLLLTIGRFGAGDQAAFGDLCRLLERHYPTIDCLIIYLDAPAPPDGPQLAPLRFTPRSGDDGVNFFDEADNIALAALLRETIVLA